MTFRPFAYTALAVLLSACSNQAGIDVANIESKSGGEITQSQRAWYWADVVDQQPLSAYDHVKLSNQTSYHSEYHWQDGVLSEVVRQGSRIEAKGRERQSFRTHLRFDSQGQAVYQQDKVDQQVFPLTPDAIADIKQQANHVITTLLNSKSSRHLIQGFWDGKQFLSCHRRFHYALDSDSKATLANKATPTYVAGLGYTTSQQVALKQILDIDAQRDTCLEPQVLLEK
ncbi:MULTISPECIES: DUF1481 domain-containing protein [unclassified Vibrio]|uniref:DUF1481 domain-containing protein n=1 Tax=Vibrio sp. HB236076 TaxID=3232307 RepID=A0AB39HFF2_9VIBR|nr:DUF1481 domain-containing protein [Vibrio sp. HB161653]MDP5255462.1 DUF1481 domain-containing protein [Vibrio sp. HB161653]